MAAAGLRRAAAAAAGRRFLRAGAARTEDRELFFERAALAVGADYRFGRRTNDRLEAVIALATLVFENRHNRSPDFSAAMLLPSLSWRLRAADDRAESAPAQ